MMISIGPGMTDIEICGNAADKEPSQRHSALSLPSLSIMWRRAVMMMMMMMARRLGVICAAFDIFCSAFDG